MVSYGLNRDRLEELNFLIKNSDHVKYDSGGGALGDRDYTFTMYSGLSPPGVMLRVPLLAELFGAGFTKAPKCKVRVNL